MEFQATDNFGNLCIGESSAQSFDELTPHVHLLVDAVRDRAGDQYQITVDLEYFEISGPDPENVSHIVRVPWLAKVDQREAREVIAKIVADYKMI